MNSILSKRSAIILLILLLSLFYMAATSKEASAARQTKEWIFLSDTSTVPPASFIPPAMWWDSGPNNWDWPGSKVTSGDFNGDGLTDVAVLYGYKTTRQSRLWVFISGGSFEAPTMWWDSGPNNWDWEGSMLTSGDYDDDGVDDVGVLYGYTSTRQTRAFVFTSNGATAFNPPTAWWDSGPNNWDQHGSKLTSADFTGDGADDMGVLYGYQTTRQSKAWIFNSDTATASFNPPTQWWDSGANNWDWDGSKLTSGNYDGTSTADMAVLYGYATTRQTKAWVFTADTATVPPTAFNTPAEWWDSGPNNWDWPGNKLTSGDFTGDGTDDMGVLYGYKTTRQSKAWIFTSDSTDTFNPPTQWWDSGANNWDWDGSKLTSGDYNGDGASDFNTLYGYQ